MLHHKITESAVYTDSDSPELYPSGSPPSSEATAGPYPFMVRSVDGRQVPVVQAYAFGKYLGYLKVTFDEAGNVVKSTGNPILLDSSVPQGYSIIFLFFHIFMLRFLRKEKNDRVDQRMVLKASKGVEEVYPCFYYNIRALKSNIPSHQIPTSSPTWRNGKRVWPTTRPRRWERLWSS